MIWILLHMNRLQTCNLVPPLELLLSWDSLIYSLLILSHMLHLRLRPQRMCSRHLQRVGTAAHLRTMDLLTPTPHSIESTTNRPLEHHDRHVLILVRRFYNHLQKSPRIALDCTNPSLLSASRSDPRPLIPEIRDTRFQFLYSMRN